MQDTLGALLPGAEALGVCWPTPAMLVEDGSREQDTQCFRPPHVQAEHAPTARETLPQMQEEGSACVGMGNRPGMEGHQ